MLVVRHPVWVADARHAAVVVGSPGAVELVPALPAVGRGPWLANHQVQVRRLHADYRVLLPAHVSENFALSEVVLGLLDSSTFS